MDAGPFIQLLNSQSHVEFVKLLDQKLQELNFKLVLKDLGPAVFDQEVCVCVFCVTAPCCCCSCTVPNLQRKCFVCVCQVHALLLFGLTWDVCALRLQADQHAAALAFLMQCLLYCQQHVGELSAGIKHLLLELIPAASAQAARKDVKTTAVRLFHAYCTPQDAKLAAKVGV